MTDFCATLFFTVDSYSFDLTDVRDSKIAVHLHNEDVSYLLTLAQSANVC